MYWAAIFLICLIVIMLLKYHLSRIPQYKIARKLPGPTALPIIGNALEFFCKNEELLSRFIHQVEKYPKPMRFWMGQKLLLVFSAPDDIEQILSSSKMNYKDDLYRFMKPFLGNGLISGSGPRWKIHRKIIAPLFSNDFIESSNQILTSKSKFLVKSLTEFENRGWFDIEHILHCCVADFIGTTVMGCKLKSQNGENMKFMNATRDAYELIHARMSKAWLHYDVVFNLTAMSELQKRLKLLISEVITTAIQQAKIRMQKNCMWENVIIDQIWQKIRNTPQIMDDSELEFHLTTLYVASEDTIATVCAFVLLCLGMHPDIQHKVADELKWILEDQNKEITREDVSKMLYLEMCVKEALRLFPIAPFFLRKTTEDFKIGDVMVPSGCTVVISVWSAHRDPQFWEKPNEFFPEHFMPDAVNKRHNFSFIPFSAGPRGCIGKLFAFHGIKVILADILRNFTIYAEGKVDSIKLKTDISVRPIDGYKVRLKRRQL